MVHKEYAIDCSKYPSDTKCDLKITGSDRQAVEDAAYFHAIGPMHRYDRNDPDLKKKIASIVEEKEAELAEA
jgi:hypothetical protein